MKHLQNYPLINESRSQEITESKFKELLNSKCSSWSLKNSQIYRGISSNIKPFLYINPKGHGGRLLKSNDGVNIYTIIMDNASQWKYYPKRSESIIATNDWSFTSDYAEWDENDNLLYHIVIPFDNTKWGITPKDDLWFAYEPSILGLRDLNEFNHIISNVISKMRGVYRADINTLEDLKNILGQIDYKDTDTITEIIEDVKSTTIAQEIIEFGKDTIIYRTLDKLKQVENSEEALKVIMSSLEPNGFSLQIYRNQGLNFTRKTQECWSSGECLMIRRDIFEKMFGKN